MQADAGRAGQRFCLLYEPQGRAVRGAIVFVHAFAEEMNKSRRMVALQARALAEAGFCVLQIDLHGCGDSSGDFVDASWQGWVEDIAQAARWLKARTHAPLWLWGQRAGCLIAVEAARQGGLDCHFLFWSPPSSGKAMLQQFLRVKIAGDMLAGSTSGGTDALRKELADGRAVEVGGYFLTGAIAQGLEQAVLTPPPGLTNLIEWIELAVGKDASLSLVSRKSSELWGEAGYRVHCHIVQGPAFWQTAEIVEVPGLLAATVAALSDDSGMESS